MPYVGGVVKKETEIIKLNRILISDSGEDDILEYFRDNIKCISYEMLLSQKLLLKIYNSKSIKAASRKCLWKLILDHYEERCKELVNHISFIESLCPIMEKLYDQIKDSIKNDFENSLFTFIYLISRYVYENPGMLPFPKTLLIHIAETVLINDTNWRDLQSKLLLAESNYLGKRHIIGRLYKMAIEYGCIFEKYDDLSYLREDILCIESEERPIVRFTLHNRDFELGLLLGTLYDSEQFMYKMSKEPGVIHQYYKCKACKYCYLTNQNDENKDIIIELLNRQFSEMSFTDMIYLFTGDIPSYIFSILGYLYTEFLKLLILSGDTFKNIKINDIRKEMYFADYITTEDFNECMNAIFNERQGIASFYSSIPFIKIDDNIIVARWMFNEFFSIVEETKNIALNAKKGSVFGKSADFFGKSVFESTVKNFMKDYNWKVLNSSLKVSKTDFDLVAYKSGCVVLGQLKVAHAGVEKYQIWKAQQTLKKALDQINECKRAIFEDKNLLFSNLKREKIITKKEDIKNVIYAVITSSNYFCNMKRANDVSVIGLDMFVDVLMRAGDNIGLFEEILTCPFGLYEFNCDIIETENIIKTEKFVFYFNEIE